jgi:hypothetical protein
MQPEKPKSAHQTLEELKAQIARSRPVVVDSTGRLYAVDQPGQPGPATPPRPPQRRAPAPPEEGRPYQPRPANYPYQEAPEAGMRVKPSRWF